MLRSLGVAGDTDSGRRAGRGPRRPGGRGGRRPLPPRLRPTRRRRRRSAAPTRSTLARAAVGDPQAGLAPADAEAGHRRPARAGRVRATRSAPRSTAASAASAILSYDDLLEPARRRARGRRRAGPRADAAALADRAGRRVPGHRPGAVGGARPGLQRARHDGADRRPEAGDLRLPRRRRRHLPRGRRDRHHPARPSPPTGAATPPLVDALQAVLRGAALGDPRIVVRDVERRTTGEPAGRRAGRRAVPPAARAAPRTSRPAATALSAIDRLRAAHRRRPRRRHRARCSPPARRSTASRSAPATSRVLALPASSRPSRSGPRCSTAAIPAVVAGGSSVLLTPGRPTSGSRCSRRSSSRTAPTRVRAAALTSFVGRHRRRRSTPAATSSPTSVAERLRGWARPVRAAAAWPRCSRRSTAAGLTAPRARRGRRRAAADRPAPPRPGCCTRPPAASGSGCRPCSSGCATERREAAQPRPSAPAGSTPTRRPCRSSPSTRSKGLQYPVVYLPSALRLLRRPSRPTPLVPRRRRHAAASTSPAAARRPTRAPAPGRGGRRGAAADSTSR